MARPDDELQDWFSGLSFKVKKRLAGKIKDEADRLASAIKAAAPVKSGALRDTVQVRRKKSDVDLEVTAGGDATTKEIRAGSGITYDYSRAVEFGTVNAPAEPFFFNTYREMAPEIRQNIEDAVQEAINS
ncbi:MAG: HK97-gp10 family putative phage morphogenesis protein [Bryobacteraceae bacterium]